MNCCFRLGLFLAVVVWVSACKPDDPGTTVDRQMKPVVPQKLNVEPSVVAVHDSPSGRYRLEILAYPEIEECRTGLGSFSLVVSRYAAAGNEIPCGYRIVERKTGKSLVEYAMVEQRLARELTKPSCSFDRDIVVLHGFERWTADDQLLYTVDSLWFGAADYAATTYIYSWSDCKITFAYEQADPHCPGACNSVLYYTFGKQEYLFYRQPETETIILFKRKGPSIAPHDFYVVAGSDASYMSAVPDPNKVDRIGSFTSKKRPHFENDGDGNLIIKTDKGIWRFDISEERLEKELSL